MNMTRRILLWLLCVVLVIVGGLFYVTRTQNISQILGCAPSDVIRFQLLESKSGAQSTTMSADGNDLVAEVFRCEVSYRGSQQVIRSNIDTPIYHLTLALEDKEITLVLGPEGCIYMDGDKFKVGRDTDYEKILNICGEYIQTR